MAMEAAARIAPKPRAPFAPSHPWDRNFFLAYVALLWCGILGGFVPEIVQHIAQRKPPFPLIIHVHGIVFLGWLVLLTAQVVLMALHNICRERATTMLIVAHDTAALAGADQVLDMREINRATGRLDDEERP